MLAIFPLHDLIPLHDVIPRLIDPVPFLIKCAINISFIVIDNSPAKSAICSLSMATEANTMCRDLTSWLICLEVGVGATPTPRDPHKPVLEVRRRLAGRLCSIVGLALRGDIV